MTVCQEAAGVVWEKTTSQCPFQFNGLSAVCFCGSKVKGYTSHQGTKLLESAGILESLCSFLPAGCYSQFCLLDTRAAMADGTFNGPAQVTLLVRPVESLY